MTWTERRTASQYEAYTATLASPFTPNNRPCQFRLADIGIVYVFGSITTTASLGVGQDLIVGLLPVTFRPSVASQISMVAPTPIGSAVAGEIAVFDVNPSGTVKLSNGRITAGRTLACTALYFV